MGPVRAHRHQSPDGHIRPARRNGGGNGLRARHGAISAVPEAWQLPPSRDCRRAWLRPCLHGSVRHGDSRDPRRADDRDGRVGEPGENPGAAVHRVSGRCCDPGLMGSVGNHGAWLPAVFRGGRRAHLVGAQTAAHRRARVGRPGSAAPAAAYGNAVGVAVGPRAADSGAI